MNENSYEEYKRNFSRNQKRQYNFRGGRMCFFVGIGFLIYLLYILPFHADHVSEIHGDEVKAGKLYSPEKVCYIEDLQILRAKTDVDDDDELYCIAKFLDCDGNEWLISFTPGRNEELAEWIRIAGSLRTDFRERPLTVSGYFHLRYLEELPFEADSFFSVYGSSYADGQNMLSINAEYLCGKYDNYTLQILLHPGLPLLSLVVGLLSTVFGGISWLRNRPRKTA
ncbi:MAG: hypothetical protein NC409_11675 [Clostridium sp.]|nr:hypothetical protein [Clostridium sp.]